MGWSSKYGLMDRNRSVRINRPGWFPMYYPPFIENGDASFLYLDCRNQTCRNQTCSLPWSFSYSPPPGTSEKLQLHLTTYKLSSSTLHWSHPPPPFLQSTLPHRARLSKSLRVLDIGRQTLLHLLLLGRQLDRQFLGGLRIWVLHVSNVHVWFAPLKGWVMSWQTQELWMKVTCLAVIPSVSKALIWNIGPKLNAKALHSMLLVQIAYVYNANSMLSTLQLIQNKTTQQYTTYHHEMHSASGHVHICHMWSKWLPALYCRPFIQWTKRFCAVKPVQSHSNLLYKTEKNNTQTRFLICCTTTNMKIQSSKDLQVSGSLRTWKSISAFWGCKFMVLSLQATNVEPPTRRFLEDDLPFGYQDCASW